jgi:hypothetical protein
MLYIKPSDVTTPIWAIATGLSNVGQWFYTLWNTTRNVPILGTWLSSPFYNLYILFNDAWLDMYSFGLQADTFIRYLDNALAYFNLDTAINNIWSDFIYFIHYPLSWVTGYVKALIKDADSFLYNPGGWIVSRIWDYSSDVWNWLINTESKLRAFIQKTSQSAYNLFYDESTFLVNMAYKKDYNLGKLFSDPVNYIKSLIPGIPQLPGDLLTNPGGFVIGYFISELQVHAASYKDKLYPLAERFLRLLWEGVF